MRRVIFVLLALTATAHAQAVVFTCDQWARLSVGLQERLRLSISCCVTLFREARFWRRYFVNIGLEAVGGVAAGERLNVSHSARYAVTDELTVMAGYYHYIQNSYFGTTAGGPTPCFDSQHSQCAGTFDAVSAAVDWRFAPKWDLYFGLMFSQQNDGLAFGFLQRSNIDPTVGLRFRF